MEDRKTYTFPTDVFYKLQNFISNLITEEMNKEEPNDEEIDELNNMQYYLEEFHKEGSDDDSIEIELAHEDYEFLFDRLLIPAIYSFDWKEILDETLNRCEELLNSFDEIL